MIGDSMTDYEGAMTVGIPFIGRVPQDKEDLFPVPIIVIRDFNVVISLPPLGTIVH